jgi:hypothetical protein
MRFLFGFFSTLSVKRLMKTFLVVFSLRFFSCRLINRNITIALALAVTAAIVGSLHVRYRGLCRR